MLIRLVLSFEVETLSFSQSPIIVSSLARCFAHPAVQASNDSNIEKIRYITGDSLSKILRHHV